jgi:signal transduction histidine kinase/CheY-like chemotaxis protein
LSRSQGTSLRPLTTRRGPDNVGVDEIGVLSTAFNEMLELIQRRDVSIQEARDTLEQRVEERTVELQGAKDRLEESLESEQLARTAADEARVTAEAANRTKSIFLANMSHEIRTPMNAILGYAQILGGYGDLSNRHQRAIRTIQSSGEHLLRLINDVLDISKIEAGREVLNPTDFDLTDLVQDLGAIFDVRCAEKNLEWRLTTSGLSGRAVTGDEGKLRQILINLLANGVKFTETGSVSLDVRSLEEDRYRFVVSDTGTGIEDGQLAEVFKPFHQTQGGMDQGGTGLGLAIAHHHVDMMGGQLELDSTEGQGARFEFSLALPAAAHDAPSRGHQDVDWSRVERISESQQVTALVVDDVETNRDILAQMLESIGVTTRTAAGGREALEKVHQSKPDIIFLDIRMPDLDGEETLKQLIETYGEGMPRCVAVTASVFVHQRERYMEAGFDEFLDKPLRAEKVYATLSKQLGVRFDLKHEEETQRANTDWTDLEIPKAIHEGLSSAAAEQSVSDLRRQVDELATLGNRERQFADHLRALAEKYDLDGIRAVLEDVGRLE